MSNRRRRRTIAFTAALSVLASAALAVPSSAGPGTFGCKVTALRIGATELAVANPAYNPCQDSTRSKSIATPEAVEGYAVTAEALIAATNVEPRYSEAAASALNLKVVAGTFTLEAGQALFGTKSECVYNSQGKPTARHPSQTATAAGITITPLGGTPIAIVPDAHQDIPIPGVGTAHVMHESVNDTRPGHKTDEVTVALLYLDVANGPDVTLLESKTDFSGQPCAPGQTG